MIFRRDNEQVNIRRVWGGFCWPSERYGYCCAVGERTDPEIDEREGYIFKLYFLGEYTELDKNKSTLIDGALSLGERFRVERWYGRGYNDVDNYRFSQQWNRSIRKRSDPEFILRPALNTNTSALTYHIGVLDSCLRPGRSLLNWLKGTEMERELMRLHEVPEKEITCERYPALAACGYVVSMLRALPAGDIKHPMFG